MSKEVWSSLAKEATKELKKDLKSGAEKAREAIEKGELAEKVISEATRMKNKAMEKISEVTQKQEKELSQVIEELIQAKTEVEINVAIKNIQRIIADMEYYNRYDAGYQFSEIETLMKGFALHDVTRRQLSDYLKNCMEKGETYIFWS